MAEEKLIKRSNWSWVKAGIILGILNILIFLSGNHLGTTTAYSQTSGYLAQFFFPNLIPADIWTTGTCGGTTSLYVGWQWIFVFGIFLGGLLGGKFRHMQYDMPKIFIERFGKRPRLRFLHAFIGGFLLLVGARLAGGCTSSHIISGMSQMAVSGILFAAAVFISGIPTALILYKRRNKA